MERSSSTFPQTHIFFVSNIKGLAETVLTWEGKVFAAADAAETNWKHKVTPDRVDLIFYICCHLSRARINSWIELELIINSIQFSINWIGIELKDFELELNWNWKSVLIGIDQFNQFIFNSTPNFTKLNFFVCHIMEIAVWQAILCKHTHMLHCVFPAWGL